MTPEHERAIREHFSSSQAEALLSVLRDESEQGLVPDRLVPIPEAAAALGCSRSTLYALMAAGRVRSIHLGRRRLIPASALTEVAEGR